MDSKELEESRRYLSRIAVWPGPKRLDIQGWLANFDEGSDTDVALALLESHVHLDEEQISYAVYSTIRGISSGSEFGSPAARPANWRAFTNSVVISFPLSHSGDATASGYIFARIASALGFPENRILDTEHLIRRLADRIARPVLFLDDLAASGTQFCRGWKRSYTVEGTKMSLANLLEQGLITSVYYLPVVSTKTAKTRIEEECGVVVVPTYLLDEDYSALSANSRLVPVHLRALVPDFLEKYGSRTGRNEYGNAGFGELGLALSFHHGCPNNTLPLLQWAPAGNDWKTLIT